MVAANTVERLAFTGVAAAAQSVTVFLLTRDAEVVVGTGALMFASFAFIELIGSKWIQVLRLSALAGAFAVLVFITVVWMLYEPFPQDLGLLGTEMPATVLPMAVSILMLAFAEWKR